MIKEDFINKFFKSIKTKNVISKNYILNDDLIENISYDVIDGNTIIINGQILSENLYNTYTTYIDIELDKLTVQSARCTCGEFEQNELKKNNYVCNHIISTFFKIIPKITEDTSILQIIKDKREINKLLKTKLDADNLTLDKLIKNNNKEFVTIDIYINKNIWSKKLSLEFRIGKLRDRKRYFIKDLATFILNIANGIPIYFSKDFEFSLSEYRLTDDFKSILDMITSLYSFEQNLGGFRKRQETLLNKKEIILPSGFFKMFLESIKNSKIFLNSGFYSREIETEVLQCDIPLPVEMIELENEIVLDFPRGLPEDLTGNNDIFLYDTIIYIPSIKQSEKLTSYLDISDKNKQLKFKRTNKDRIFRELIPSLQSLTNSLILDESISNQIIFENPKFKFYFHRDDYIRAVIKVIYREYEFNIFDDIKEKYIYRNRDEEGRIIDIFKSFKFSPIDDNTFVFIGSEDNAFDFFNDDIDVLHSFGEIFYSDTFKGKLKLSESDFNIHISRGREEYFSFDYNVSNIPNEEFGKILLSFRENKKYHKLNSGEYIDLEEIRLKELLLLISGSKTKDDNTLVFNKNKSIYLYEKLNNIVSTYIGKDTVKYTKDKILEEEKYILPNINATLRNYQIQGFNYFKRLSSLSLGGILGDEMGLGKTLQAIAFIASEKMKKTLIVAPTSLVYNWENEFLKFAPDINVVVNVESKERRRKILENIEEVDVIITSYNILKNDIDIYKTLTFDYMFIDEAQYIKNPTAKVTKSCKEIIAKSKFALTGTPIENNLIELWSIFDFLMPDYLFDKATFNTKYNRNLFEDDILILELKKLIAPFILRRLKRDVLKELPEKIEKIVYVDMTKEQKKMYAAYVKYVNELLEKRVSLDEFKNDSIEILSYITKLRQISLHPSLISNEFTGASGKLIALKEIVTDTIDNGHKILIFSQFTSALKIVEEMLNLNGISNYYIDGSIKSSKRIELVERFNIDTTQVFLISLKAGGTGLNLTSADIVIHLDPWWNPAVENQATDRAHRIGQKNVVEVIKLISKGSIEEKIINLQEKKREISESLLDSDNETTNLFNKLSKEDILKLIQN